MSGGHKHLHAFGMSGAQLDRILDQEPVKQRLHMDRKIIRDFDMPYVGGYSVDGKNIYADRHLPNVIELELDGRKKEARVDDFLFGYMGHEPVEWSVMDGLGWSYGAAHSGPATGSEHRRVTMILGPGWWNAWQKAIGRYVKADEHERLIKMPADYDLRPILFPPCNEQLLAAVRRAMKKGRSDG